MAARFCDLHTHSDYSDGKCPPESVVRLAAEAGLSAVALTDHNTLSGVPEFIRAGEAHGIDAVAGTEITTEYDGREVHVVALFVTERHSARLNELLEHIQLVKDAANYKLYRRLTEAGYSLSWEHILQSGRHGNVNRVHFAQELMRQGVIGSVKEGFDGILSRKRGLYTPAPREDCLETIAFLRELGVVSVLAHPFLNLDGSQLDALLPQAKAAGLDAMECYYSRFTEEQTRAARALCETHGLLESGGSDFHGENKPDIRVGTGTGALRVPDACYRALQALAKQRA